MRWIVDAQQPPALASLLNAHGQQAEHVEAIGLRDGPDTEIWNEALKRGAVIVTKDEDFQNRALVAQEVPPIVWIRMGNSSRAALLDWFEPLLDDITERLENGETMIEIR